MNDHVKEFFHGFSDDSPSGNFHRVFALHEAPDIDCESLRQMVPDLSKGWYELAILDTKDRIEFTRDFWLDTLPYSKSVNDFITDFFGQLDDVGVFVTQKNPNDPFETCLVYSLKGNMSFYRGGSPASDEQVAHLQKQFPKSLFPLDYKAFLRIHNGFWKTTDCTGIIRASSMPEFYRRLQLMVAEMDGLVTSEGKDVDPSTLIPFYESFGMPFFQCFWSEWYPGEEMGNVYISRNSKVINLAEGEAPSPENMAFPTFLDWLVFYLERVT